MSRRIGEVWVAIEADTRMFRAQAVAGVTKALAGVEGKIPVTADTAKAQVQIAALKARMTDLNRQLAEVKIGADGKPAEAVIRRLQLELKTLAETVGKITLDADTRALDAKIARQTANLRKLQQQASKLKLDADDRALISKIADLELLTARLNQRLGSLDVDADPLVINQLIKKIRSVDAQIAVLNARAQKIKMRADAVALKKQIIEVTALIERLKAEASDLKLGGKADLGALAAAEGRLLGLEEAARKLNPEIGVTNAKLIQGARGFGRFGLGALGARVALFGGLSAVSGWHIALDTIIESLAVIVPALVTAAAGLGAFGLAGSDAARAVYHRLQNIHVVSDALNATIPPMTSNLEKLHDTVRPQVWQLYGDAIAIAHSKTGLFNKLAVQTGSVIDTLAARITVLATTSGGGLNRFLASGARDLKEFGRIFVSLGDAFGKLIQVTEQTHIAEFLLNVFGAAAKLFQVFTKLPIPILALVVGLHGIYLWSGLAASALIALLRPLGRMAAAAAGAELAGTAVKDLAAAGNDSRFARLGATFSDLGRNLKAIPGRAWSATKAVGSFLVSPWGLVAVGVVALAGLVYGLSKTKSATDRFIDSLNTMTTHATDFTIINTLAGELTLNSGRLAASQGELKGKLKDVAAQSKIYGGTLAYQNANINQSNEDVRDLTANHAKLVKELTRVTSRLSFVTDAFGTHGLAGAMALAHLAGVGVNELMSDKKDVWAAAVQKIAGVVQGYKNMGQGATQLANDINVLTIAQSDELRNVEALNAGFDNFTKIVSGPILGFLAFANTLKRFGQDASVAGAHMSGLGTGFTKVSKKATDASLQLQSDFQDTFNAAAQMADAFRLTGEAGDKQIAAIKDWVQVMIPMAGSNKAAAAEISVLAQEAGGPATTNLKTLAKWAGKTADPLGKAQKAAADAAISFFDMSRDAQKLGTTLAQDLTKDAAAAVESAVGLQGAMNQFALDIRDAGTSIKTTSKDRKALVEDLAAVNIVGPEANNIINAISGTLRNAKGPIDKAGVAFEDFAIHGLHLSTKKADELWKKLNESNLVKLANNVTTIRGKWIALAMDGLKLNHDQAEKLWKKLREQYLDTLGTKTDIARGKWIKLAMGGLDLTYNQADKLWRKLGQQRLDEAGRKADTTRSKFEQLARQIGVNKDKADLWFDALHRLPKNTNLKISVDAKGFVKVNGVEISAGAYFSPHAEGGFISGGKPGKDSVLGMLMPGEVVVPAKMVQRGAVDHLRGQLPGFNAGGQVAKPKGYASGGLVGNTGDLRGDFPQRSYNAIKSFDADSTIRTAVAATKKFAAYVKQQQAKAAAAGGMGDSGARTHSAAVAQAYARSLLSQYHWGPDQMNSLIPLWNAESGWNAYAANPTSNARGIPQSISGWASYAPGDYKNQIIWGLNYIRSRYGSPAAAWSFWQRQSPHWYAQGGLVPGFATGGVITTGPTGGPAAVTALRKLLWKERHGEGVDYLGLLHAFQRGPAKYRTKLTMQELATLGRRQGATQLAYTHLTGAGLTKAHLNALGAEARAEIRTASDQWLNRIPGGHPGWAKGLRYWLGQLSKTAMKGLPGGQLTTGPTGAGLPALTHVYGGDVGDTIGAYLAKVMSPFRNGGLVMDKGGWLKPGWNPPMYNGTGRNERVGGTGDVTVTLLVDTASGTAMDQMLAQMIKKYVKVHGGSVERAYGPH